MSSYNDGNMPSLANVIIRGWKAQFDIVTITLLYDKDKHFRLNKRLVSMIKHILQIYIKHIIQNKIKTSDNFVANTDQSQGNSAPFPRNLISHPVG